MPSLGLAVMMVKLRKRARFYQLQLVLIYYMALNECYILTNTNYMALKDIPYLLKLEKYTIKVHKKVIIVL